MDLFDEDLFNFFQALQQHHVKYIMVGGYAVNLHGYPRYTGDLDLWLKDTIENRKQLRKVFISCDMGDFPMIETMDFVPGWTEFHLNNSLVLDILTEMKGLEEFTFEECLHMASVADIDNVQIPFLHLNQLIENKKVINRGKDQVDVIALEKIRELREEKDRNDDQN
jgi:hypothetical protein